MRTALTELFGIDVPLVGFSRSPAVVAEVSKAGGLGVLAATAYGPEELDVQLTWIEEQVRGRPYGVDVLVPASTVGDRRELVARLRAQIPAEHIEFVRSLLEKYGVEPGDLARGHGAADDQVVGVAPEDRKSTRLNSSHVKISYAVFCLKKKKKQRDPIHPRHHPGP